MSPEIARKLVESLRPPAMDECGLTSRELSLLLQDSACDAVTKDLAGRTVDDAVVMIRGQVAGSSARSTTPQVVAPRLDPSTMQRLTTVAALLEPAEPARLMKLGPKLMSSPDAIDSANTLASQSPESAAEWVRANLDQIEARFGS
jgi:hypothetical protein